MKKLALRGSMTALVTPFKSGKIDFAAFEKHVEDQIRNGTDALVPCGTTGESATMTQAEQLSVIESCVKAAKKRVPVVAGTGKNDTAGTIELTKRAMDLGADAALVVTPYYNKPTQDGLYAHFTAIADAVEIPLVLYNVPGRTGVNMTAETTARLAKHARVVAVKEASGDLVQAAEIVRLVGDDLQLISGEDALTFPMICLGGSGVISVTSNVVPGDFSKMCQAALAGDLATARKIHLRLLPLMRVLFVETSPGPAKHALAKLGRMSAEMRLPLVPIAEASAKKVDATLAELGIK